MESEYLRGVLGLSSCKSEMQKNQMGNFKLGKKIELF